MRKRLISLFVASLMILSTFAIAFAEEVPTERVMHNIYGMDYEDGKIVPSKDKAYAGETVTFEAIPADGYAVDEHFFIEYNSGSMHITTNSFVMPDADVQIITKFMPLSIDKVKHDIFVKNLCPNAGTVTVSPERAFPGDVVTINVEANSGFTLDYLKLNGNLLNVTEFKMPDENVEIEAAFKMLSEDAPMIKTQVNGPGSMSYSPSNPKTGDRVTLNLVPNKDCYLVQLRIGTPSGLLPLAGKYFFTMPSSRVFIEAIFDTEPNPEFNPDIKPEDSKPAPKPEPKPDNKPPKEEKPAVPEVEVTIPGTDIKVKTSEPITENITPNQFKEIINVTKKSVIPAEDEKIQINSMSSSGTVVEAKMLIDPADAKKFKHPVNTKIETNPNYGRNTVAKKKFEKFFENEIQVVTFMQDMDFEADIEAAVKVDISKFSGDTLYIYNYNVFENHYQLIDRIASDLDDDGFLHFITQKGNAVIITDRPLKLK